MRALDDSGVIAKLQRRCHNAPQRKVAEDLGVSQSYLSDVIRGRSPPSARLLKALGLRKAYVPL